MATTTYVPLISYTLNSATASVVLGSGGQGTIPSTYTDLVLIVNGYSGDDYYTVRFNGDSDSSYSRTLLYGSNGSGGVSTRSNNITEIYGTIGNSSSNIGGTVHNIMSYSNNSIFKTIIRKGFVVGNPQPQIEVGLWRSTSTITSITLTSANGNFGSSTSFILYGIANTDTGAKATGGIITYDSTYYYHTFGASGTFTPNQNLSNVDYLVVAGGGGAGRGGGGGAGGLRSTVDATGGGGSLESKLSLTNGTAYTITIGSGGAGNDGDGNRGSSGIDSSISGSGLTTITSSGGSGGGCGGANNPSILQGGSGGGGSFGNPSGSTNGGLGTNNQGYAGGNGGAGIGGGGGGGAGAVGGNAVYHGNPEGGSGGDGVAIPGMASTTGTGAGTYYAGGGGGATHNDYGGGVGGKGGGGQGEDVAGGTKNSTSGTTNTGGGGGGSHATGPNNGGSGIVIIRYPKA